MACRVRSATRRGCPESDAFGEVIADSVEAKLAALDSVVRAVRERAGRRPDHPRLLMRPSQLRDGGTNPRLELAGVVMTMFDGRTRLSQQVVSEVRQHFGDKVFETVIPRTTRLAEAPSFGKPIIHYDKYSAGAAAYEVLTQEFLQRLATP